MGAGIVSVLERESLVSMMSGRVKFAAAVMVVKERLGRWRVFWKGLKCFGAIRHVDLDVEMRVEPHIVREPLAMQIVFIQVNLNI